MDLITRPRLFVDMDGTLADWNTNASMSDLRKEGYYAALTPNKGLIRALYMLRDCVELHILTAYLIDVPYPFDDKKKWLKKYVDFIPEKNVHMVPYGTCKAALPILRSGDVLLDDYTVNLIEWNSAQREGKNLGLRGIKALNGINGKPVRWRQFGLLTHSPHPGLSINILDRKPEELAAELFDDVLLATEPDERSGLKVSEE